MGAAAAVPRNVRWLLCACVDEGLHRGDVCMFVHLFGARWGRERLTLISWPCVLRNVVVCFFSVLSKGLWDSLAGAGWALVC